MTDLFNKDTKELTPNDIYALPVQEVERSPSVLVGCYYDHLEGSGLDNYGVQYRCRESTRLEVRIHKFFNFDGRRFWRLASVWLDNKPVMIIQNAGREGDDHSRRYITDEPLFREMACHIQQLVDLPEKELSDVVDPTKVIGRELIDFYGNHLLGYFEHF